QPATTPKRSGALPLSMQACGLGLNGWRLGCGVLALTNLGADFTVPVASSGRPALDTSRRVVLWPRPVDRVRAALDRSRGLEGLF
ncbi:MAG: hypothetical protein ACOVS5_08830, partial [Oligoflexus sp.]